MQIGKDSAHVVFDHSDFTLTFGVGRAGIPAEPDGRQAWRYAVIAHPKNGPYRTLAQGEDLSTGPGVAGQPPPGPREALASLLSFADCDAERYAHVVMRQGHSADGYSVVTCDADAEYLYGVADEIGMTRIELEEGASL